MAIFWKTWRAWFVGVPILLIVVGSIVCLSPSFETCRDENSANQASTQQLHKNESSLKIVVRCTGTFIDSNHDSITAIATVFIALFTITLWWASAGQYDLIEQQIKLARDDFNATHRPWISVTSVTINFGLTWVQGNAMIGLNVFCKNTGNSPAQRVSLAANVFPFLVNDDIPGEIAKLQESHRTSTRRPILERTLFPGTQDDLLITRGLMITEAEIASLKDIHGDPAVEMIPVILGSIEYYFSFGERVPHYTPLVFHLWRTMGSPDVRLTFGLDGSNVEARNMILVELMSAGDPT
jgi:hypothetical protein